jgi:PTS system mannose-specific IIC component
VENILLGLLGSLLILDTTIVLQSLISQPLFTCSIIGWILGDIQLGLQLGVYLQILWLSMIPVGTAIIPEGNTAAIVTTVLVFRYHQDHQIFNTVLVGAVLYSLLIAYLGSSLVDLYGKRNVKLLNYTLARLQKGSHTVLTTVHARAILFHFIVMLLLITGALIVGDIVFSLLSLVPVNWEVYFSYGVTALLGIGVGLILPMYKEQNCRLLIFSGVVVGSIILLVLR